MKAQIVSFHCILRDRTGRIVSSTFNQDVITHVDGGAGMLRGLADGLRDLHKGEKRQIFLRAEQAYGFYDPDLLMEVSRRELKDGEQVHAGSQVLTRSSDGELRTFRVVQVAGDRVTLDGNHPLAGQDLTFHIEATEAREATDEELLDARLSDPGARTLH
jgi:FKBP-type peptidyl-prolyl cis-trans isomerase SlyD